MESRLSVLLRYGVDGKTATHTREIDYLADQIAETESALADKLGNLNRMTEVFTARLVDAHLPSPTSVLTGNTNRVVMLTAKLVLLDDLMTRAVEARADKVIIDENVSVGDIS